MRCSLALLRSASAASLWRVCVLSWSLARFARIASFTCAYCALAANGLDLSKLTSVEAAAYKADIFEAIEADETRKVG
jgi:hypothetical protein